MRLCEVILFGPIGLFYHMAQQSEHERIQEFFSKLGKRIRQLRKEKGYTSHEDFANRHKISRSQYGKYERGAEMQISTVVKIAEALDVSLSEFFSEGF